MSQFTLDLLASIPVEPGIARAGVRVPGSVPRDTGALAASLQSTLYGSTSLSGTGADSYVTIAAGMAAGDLARFSWGGPAAPYAAAVHSGSKGTAGTFWIDAALNRAPRILDEAVARARAEIMAP